jgi:hypothetical protein
MFHVQGKREIFIRKAAKLEAQRILSDQGISIPSVQTPPQPTVINTEFLVPIPGRTAERLRDRGAALDYGFFDLKISTFVFGMLRNPQEQDRVRAEADFWGWKQEPFKIIKLSLLPVEAAEFDKMSIDRQSAILRVVADRVLQSKTWILS